MSEMFRSAGRQGALDLDLSSFDTSNVENMGSMFNFFKEKIEYIKILILQM